MDMFLNVLMFFIGGSFVNLTCLYCWEELANPEKKLSLRSKIIIILFMSSVGAVFNFCFPKLVKFICSFIFLVLVSYFTVVKSFSKSILIVVISQLVIMLAELTFMIFGSILFGSNFSKITSSFCGDLYLNLSVALVSFLLIKTKLPLKVFDSIWSLKDIVKKRQVVSYCLMMILIAMISTAESYMNLSLSIVLFTNTVITIIFVFMVVKFARSENNYNSVNNKYRTSLSSLQEYGDMVDKYRISNHENKNQLLTIQNMTKDEKVIKYVESLLEEKKKNNDKIMNKIVQIPDGIVRSLIYAKLCKIDELGIKYSLNISSDVKTAALIDLKDYVKRDVCTILGVYIDNAIEAVNDLKKKKITVEFYILDDVLNIDVTNNFEGNLDLDKLYKPKYTTKGEGHGFGLALVDKIVGEDDLIDNECEIINNNITQRIKIKM